MKLTPVFLGAAAVCVATVSDARADVRDVATRVAEQWRAAGASVTALPTRFLYDDEKMTIVVPEPEGGSFGDGRGCTTVALLGARGLSFHARVSGVDEETLADEPTSRGASIAGVVQLERCQGAAVRQLVVSSDAGRGAIEIVVARSATSLPTLRAVLPERSGGVTSPSPEPGAVPALVASQKRAEFAEARARRDGAAVASRETWSAGTDGTGEKDLKLGAGCHRIELFAVEGRPGRKARVDLDAELRGEDDELLARDRTEAPDARLEACIGEDSDGTVVFGGAASGGDVLVTRSSWSLPSKLPSLWGTTARAKMARALLARHIAAPTREPVFLAQGGSGLTSIPLTVEPGGCYVVVSAITHGHPRGLGLRALVGAMESTDERGTSDDSGAIAFCAGSRTRVTLEVEARASSVAWGLAVYLASSRVWSGGP